MKSIATVIRCGLATAILASWFAACGKGIYLDPMSTNPSDFMRPDGADGSDASDGPSVKDSDRADTGDSADAYVDQSAPDHPDTGDRQGDQFDAGDADMGPGETGPIASDADARSDDALDERETGPTASDADARSDDALDGPDAFAPPDGCVTGCGGPDADYFVDASAPPGGDGSRSAPFTTITAAINAYGESSGQAKRVRVAPGRYDEALGEHFPLVLRGLSLEGAGQDTTFIVGSGDLDHAGEGGALNERYLATIVVGHRTLPTTISNLSARSASPIPTQNYNGIFCDRGSAAGSATVPDGVTTIDRVTIGPGYHLTLVATTSTSPIATGCNLRMTRSTLTGGWLGLYAVGCGRGVGTVPVVLDIGGPDRASGNTFSWMQLPYAGWGALLHSCVTRGTFQYNSFADDMNGLAIDQRDGGPSTRHTFTIKNNTFERMPGSGLMVFGGTPAFVDELSDNTFTHITRSLLKDNGPPAPAVTGDLLSWGKVRRNVFIGNDIGMSLSFSDAPGLPADFGTTNDHGNNVFRCNSGLTGPGADLWLDGVSPTLDSSWGGTIPMVGNQWDHAAPTIRTSDDVLDGTDVAVTSGPHVTLDLRDATPSTATCPSDRVPGP